MISPDEAMKKLIDGNERFAENKSIHPNRCNEIRNSVVDQQKPFAVILACSDSRVPVEIIFDVGIGDLFVIRSAGHVLSKEALGSIEYAVNELGVKLIMILGHGNCGAIGSAIKIYKADKHDDVSENLQSVLNHIYPAIKNLNLDDNPKDLIKAAVISNIQYQLNDLLKRDDYLAQKVQKKEILLVGAKYRLDTGLIEVL